MWDFSSIQLGRASEADTVHRSQWGEMVAVGHPREKQQQPGSSTHPSACDLHIIGLNRHHRQRRGEKTEAPRWEVTPLISRPLA